MKGNRKSMQFVPVSISSMMGSKATLYVSIMTSSEKEPFFGVCAVCVGKPFITCLTYESFLELSCQIEVSCQIVQREKVVCIDINYRLRLLRVQMFLVNGIFRMLNFFH